ncbi:hypothetical protein A3860_23010 [Niastella vici]|uniref:Uncharacterized protein n=1 Tax=Niastella vici TaxID=1703345 RepID=A0A1V9FZM0_9BACT|nr:hypothetical protein A3860_23010 [Niastella vici]
MAQFILYNGFSCALEDFLCARLSGNEISSPIRSPQGGWISAASKINLRMDNSGMARNIPVIPQMAPDDRKGVNVITYLLNNIIATLDK